MQSLGQDIASDELTATEQEVTLAGPDDVFYARLGEELVRRQLPFLNDVLRQLVTLTVTLLGGGIFFLSPDKCDTSFRLAAMLAFLMALIAAMVGMLPWGETIRLFVPDEIRAAIVNHASRKSAAIWVAAIFLCMGLCFAFAGVVMKSAAA